jgi:pimeloyl-ACP methyl ester carboxylesterase
MRASSSVDRGRRGSLRDLAWVSLALAMLAAVILAASFAAPASAAGYPVEAAYTALGPYATTTAIATDSVGNSYTLYYQKDYSELGFKSPVITWGNGSNAIPAMYSTLLGHFASYGFTVIASDLRNTGSGNEIDAGAHYLLAQNATSGSIFSGRLDTSHVAAAGHSQGAGGATRVAEMDPGLITTLMTFSLPNTAFIGTNPDCPTKADCTYDPAELTQPTFFISTHGLIDSLIASPSTETAFYGSVKGQAALGIITNSDGKAADHNSVQDASDGGNPGGELGYATAWLEYQLRGNATAAAAFAGAHPELVSNANWPGSACKQ